MSQNQNQPHLRYGDLPQPSPASSALSILSQEGEKHGEPNWPQEWQAYTALFGCFLLMFNSWA